MKLDEVAEIKETYNQEKVNELLENGFKVLKILSTKTENEVIRPLYILARPAK